MAKLTKNALKSIVKECLLEILVEGLAGQDVPEPLMEARRPRKPTSKRPQEKRSRRPALDNINFGNKVQVAVGGLTDDPVLSSILADTATTTLQEQYEQAPSSNNAQPSHLHQVSVHGDQAAKATAQADPMDMFGGASANWASLAFPGSSVEK